MSRRLRREALHHQRRVKGDVERLVDVQVDERTLREVYLPHFKKTVQKGKPASIMSAYNMVNGEYSANNKYLLTDILRDEWGFEGIVMSDWFGGSDAVAMIQAGNDLLEPGTKKPLSADFVVDVEGLRFGIANNMTLKCLVSNVYR